MSYGAITGTSGVGIQLARRSLLVRRALPSTGILARPSARYLQTESLPPSASSEILNAQRLRRPSSPHFTIYKPQITWIGSIFNRVTGAGLSVLLYGFSITYLLGPVFGAPIDSAAVISFVQTLPESLKLAGKTLLALPFTYHTFNGLRHLGWDVGQFLTLRGAYRSFYAVAGATVMGTIALVLM